MSWNNWIRQFHRWISMAFTLTVIANVVVMTLNGGQQPPPFVTFSPLLPLLLLLLSGLYLFALPYFARRGARSASPRAGG